MARRPFKSMMCYHCRREGQMMSECPKKLKTRRQQGHTDSKPTRFIAASRLTPVAREDSKIRFPKEEASCILLQDLLWRRLSPIFMKVQSHSPVICLKQFLLKFFEILELHSLCYWPKRCPFL